MEKQDKTAMVCYCTLRSGKNRNTLGRFMHFVQETMEDQGFGEIRQAFVTGADFPCASSFQSYPFGFRARPDEESPGGCFLENLVLSYGLFLHYQNSAEEKERDALYLILLREGSCEYEEELEAVLERYRKLKEALGIEVFCFSEEEEEAWEKDFADGCGKAAFLCKL